MKLTINNQANVGAGSIVVDETGAQPFTVKGKAFSVTRKKFIFDAQGNKLYTVRRKFWRWFNRASLVYDASDKKVLKLFKNTFSLENEFHVTDYDGEMLIGDKECSGAYVVTENGVVIGRIRRIGSWGLDTFEVEFEQESRAGFFVALALALDSICDEQKEEARK